MHKSLWYVSIYKYIIFCLLTQYLSEKQIFIRTINPEDETDDTTVLPVHEDIVVIKIPHKYSSPTFDRKMEWLKGNTFKTLKMFIAAYGVKHLFDCLDDIRLNDFDNYMLRNHVNDFYKSVDPGSDTSDPDET